MKAALLATTAVALLAPAAHAGETACWFENGVVVAPAEVLGVAGDYIVDTGTAHTQLAETQAQGAGFEATALTGEIRLAGVRLEARPIAVAAIDLRSGALPTPIAGVIGADVLRGYVVDVSFAPCRLTLRPDRAPALPAAQSLPLRWLGDLPVIEARAADGPHVLSGAFTAAIGSDTAVRLSDDAARAVRLTGRPIAKPVELYPYGVYRPRLRALELAGTLAENLPAGLLKSGATPALGEIGTPLLAHYRLRFDFPAGRLLLAQAKGPPDRSDGP